MCNWNLKKKFAPEEKKNYRKTSKYVKQNKYYIKNVCVCRFCHTVSTILDGRILLKKRVYEVLVEFKFCNFS